MMDDDSGCGATSTSSAPVTTTPPATADPGRSTSPTVRMRDPEPDAAESGASPAKSSGRRKHSSSGTRKVKKQRSREKLTLDVKEERQHRVKLVNELLETEKAHVQAIDVVVNNYLFPLKNIETDILPPSTLQDIFSNLELIRNWHRTFLSQLTAHLQLGETFGSLFLDMVPVLRQLYTQYNENYDHAMESYEKAKKLKAFSAFLEKKQAELNDSKALLTYLYLPIQRMIAYDSLLKDIVARTPVDHEDFQDLSTALQALRDIQQNAQRRAKQRKNIDKVIEIQNRIAGTTQLALPHRRYVYEGKILFIGPDGTSSSKRYCYLFNDLFVCCKDKKKVLEVDFKEPLGTLKVDDLPDTEDFRYLFRLTSSANEYVLSTNDKHHWMALINQYVHDMKSDSSHADEEDGSRESHSRDELVSLILQWSRDDDSARVHAAVREVAAAIGRGR